MKRYSVVLEDSAQIDVLESYKWGCRVWGKAEAQRWVRRLRSAVLGQLGVAPKAFPLAPEDEEFSEEIRHMVVARYRVLFTVRKSEVHVLHVRGAHAGDRSNREILTKPAWS
jgi:plasmid stabilization system protein ParE